MPDVLYEWSLSWLNFWHDSPVLWWSTITIAVIAWVLLWATSRRY